MIYLLLILVAHIILSFVLAEEVDPNDVNF